VPLRLGEEIQEVLRRGDRELTIQPENTLSIFRIIRSAHCTVGDHGLGSRCPDVFAN
jgi:hypothetical protein